MLNFQGKRFTKDAAARPNRRGEGLIWVTMACCDPYITAKELA
jgi:hypothetical protein